MTDLNVLEYQSTPRTQRGIYYGWVNLVIAALAMVATMPGRPQGLGLITEPLLRDLNIDPVRFGTQNLWATLIGSSFSLAIGPLIDRVGARVMLSAMLAALGATIVWMSHITGLWGLLITLTLSRGLGQCALSVVSLALVGKWFSRRLPLAMGIYAVMVCVGCMAFFYVVGKSTIHFNWRSVWALTGWTIFVGGAISWGAVRRSPESIGVSLDGLAAAEPDTYTDKQAETGFTLGQALRTPAFWAFAGGASIFGTVSAALTLFNVRVLAEYGFDASVAVNVMVVITFAGLLANFAAGLLGQKWPVGRLIALGMFLLAIALFSLPWAHGKTVVYLYAIFMGVAGGIVTVAFFASWGASFGRLHLGSIQGAAQGLTVLTSAVGPWLLAKSRDLTHSSAPFFHAFGFVVVAMGFFCLLVRVPQIPDVRK